MTPSKPMVSKRSLVLQSLLIGAILLVAWILWRRGEPERLPGFPIDYNLNLLSLGTIYRPVYRDVVSQSGPRIIFHPIQGSERILIDEDARYAFATRIAVSDGAILYGLMPYRKPTFGGGSDTSRYLGTFALSADAAALPARPGMKRVTMRPMRNAPDAIVFRQVSAFGGPPHDLATIHASDSVLVGSHVFWTRSGSETRVEVSLGSDRWTEISGKSDMMLTDLLKGSVHRIGQSLERWTNWIVGTDGVFWTAPHPFPDRARDLFYARASDGTVLRLGELQEGQSADWSVEFDGSVYWFLHAGPHLDTLMAANVDGSSVRTVLQLNPLQLDAHSGENLCAYRGSLYCLVHNAISDRTHPPYVKLARIHLGKPNRLEILRTLPAEIHQIGFDDGFVYYYVMEARRGFWETITDDDAGESRTAAIYRVPLQ